MQFWTTWHLLRSVITTTGMQKASLGANLANLVSYCAVSGREQVKTLCSLAIVTCLLSFATLGRRTCLRSGSLYVKGLGTEAEADNAAHLLYALLCRHGT